MVRSILKGRICTSINQVYKDKQNHVLTEPWKKFSLIHQKSSKTHPSRTSECQTLSHPTWQPSSSLVFLFLYPNEPWSDYEELYRKQCDFKYTSGVSMVTVLAELSIRKRKPRTHTNSCSWSTEGTKQTKEESKEKVICNHNDTLSFHILV